MTGEGVGDGTGLGILITDDDEVRAMNLQFLGIDAPTDVLSFPAVEAVTTKFAGDLAISVDIAAANARQLGHSLEDEIRVLIVHGLLHLGGYDHENDNGEMARKEWRLRSDLGLPASLIDRTEKKTTVPVKRSRKKRRSR